MSFDPIAFTRFSPDTTASGYCKDSMFGNSVWNSCWQIYDFISVNKFATFVYVVVLFFSRKFNVNFREFKIGQPTKSKTFSFYDYRALEVSSWRVRG